MEIRVPFIPFDQVGSLIQTGQIYNYAVDPGIQNYGKAVLEGASSQNTIVTLFLTNGQTYLVNSRYDPNTRMIYPPV